MTETYPRSFGTDRDTARRPDVTEQIKAYILRENLSPGDPMPTESTLCEELGASRSSVREAIKTLSALDIVTVRHGHGTYVGRLSMSALVEGLVFRAKLSSQDDFAVLEELVGVRKLLERGFAGPIVAHFDDDLHEQLDLRVREMESRLDRGEAFVEADRAFHLLLISPLRNDLVTQLTAAFWDVHAVVTPMLGTSTEDAYETVAAHRAIVAAAAAADESAFVQAIDAHYAPVLRHLADRLSQRGPNT